MATSALLWPPIELPVSKLIREELGVMARLETLKSATSATRSSAEQMTKSTSHPVTGTEGCLAAHLTQSAYSNAALPL